MKTILHFIKLFKEIIKPYFERMFANYSFLGYLILIILEAMYFDDCLLRILL